MSHIQYYFSPLYAIVGIIAGILLYHAGIVGLICLICSSMIVCILPQTVDGAQPWWRIAFLALWCCIGWCAAWYEMRPFEQLYAQPCTGITITGTVIDYMHCNHIRYPHRITLMLDTTASIPAGAVYIYTNHKTETAPYVLDDRLLITSVTLKKPPASFSRYLIKEDILGTSFVAHDAITKLPCSSQHSWHAWIYALRTRIFASIKEQLENNHFALFSALFLGNKTYDKDETDPVQTQFRLWGIAHIFARSGMHISMIIGILLYLLTLIPLPYTIKIISTSGIGIVYALCSWSTISFARAFMMFLLSNYCLLIRRQSSTLHLLGITTITALLWHPLNLFFLDFQLSFTLTGALVWICTILAKQA
jgi:ComEC/Rec2-related protein